MPEPFSVTEPFEVSIISGGRRTIHCRYPTDAEWIKLTNTVQVKRRRVGEETTIDSDEPDPIFLEVVQKIANDFKPDQTDLVDFDTYDGRAVLGRLQFAKPGEVTTEDGGKRYLIPLQVFGHREVLIVLKSPRQRQIAEYKKAGLDVRFSDKGSTARVNLRAAAVIFDALFERSEGYADGTPIPIVHKDEAIGALVANLSPEE